MRRREFISIVGGAAALVARGSRAADGNAGGRLSRYTVRRRRTSHFVAAFRKGLNETGYVEGQNVKIEYRWAEFQYERLAPMAADLVGIG